MKISKKKPKHVDTVVNSIQTLPLSITNPISNKKSNQGQKIDCFATNLSEYSRAYQDVVYDEVIYSHDCTSSYPTDSVVFLGSKPRIGINLYKYYLKATSTR